MTYDELRDLAIDAITTPSLDVEDALDVLSDALLESGVLIPWHTDFPNNWEPEEQAVLAKRWDHQWALKWAMKAVYGAARVDTHTLAIDSKRAFPDKSDHRAWTEERLEARLQGKVWKQKRKSVPIQDSSGRVIGWTIPGTEEMDELPSAP